MRETSAAQGRVILGATNGQESPGSSVERDRCSAVKARGRKNGHHRLTELAIEEHFGKLRMQSPSAQLTVRSFRSPEAKEMIRTKTASKNPSTAAKKKTKNPKPEIARPTPRGHEISHIGRIKQCKCMVMFSDFTWKATVGM